ncbi:unnamed protein product [Zymoseptoria tritici ST99CH_3D1]|nr:unnamed protein product [Zymoseptoria tritici ST99CH_3D1]
MGYGQQQQDTPPRNNSIGAPNTPAAPRPSTDAYLVESMNGDKSPQELLDCIRFVEVDSDDEEMEQAEVLAVGFRRARVDEDDGEQDARMADQPRKVIQPLTRRPSQHEQQRQQERQQQRPIKETKKKSSSSKPRKPVKPINAMIGQPAIDILAIVATIMVTIPITWLMQLSPFFRDETKRLVSQPRMRESKTKDKNANRAFGVPATITGTHGRQAVVLRNQVAADQGSEINLIYPHLRKALGLKLRDIGEIDLPPMDMSTANGGLTPLKHFVIFNLNVEGMSREVWAFACPTERSNLSLLLGVPFLHDINAVITVKTNTIQIGDKSRNEPVIHLQQPLRESDAPSVTVAPQELQQLQQMIIDRANEQAENDG